MFRCEHTMRELLVNTHAKLHKLLQSYSIVSKGGEHGMPLISFKGKKIINFDKISEWHMGRKEYGDKYRSNDAFYCSSDEQVFIEFKNGHIFHKGELCPSVLKELREKNCSSILVGMDLKWFQSLADVQANVKYILVYSSELSDNEVGIHEERIRERNMKLANEPYVPRALVSMRWLFSSLSMYSDKEFVEKFIKPRYSAA